MESMVKKTLKSLCCSNGWSYGVFWRFDQRNSMLLTLEDAYYEEQMGVVIDNMLLHVHMLGEGIIGQAAFTGKHRWMSSDAHGGEWNSLGSVEDILQDDSEIHNQFSSGIKTIAVITVEPRGVVQFGSTQKILERLDFLDQTKRLFREMENVDGLIASNDASSSLNSEIYDSNGLFASLISAGNSNHGNLKPMHGESCNELFGRACSSTNFTQSSPFAFVMQQSSQFRNQAQSAGDETQVMSSKKPDIQFQQVFSQSTTFADNLAAETPCNSTWSREGSTLTSFEQQLPSEMRVQGSPYVFPTKPNTHQSCNNSVQNFDGDSTFTSMYNAGGLLNVEKSIEYSSGILMDNQHSALSFHAIDGELLECSTSLHTFQQEFKPVELTAALSKSFPMDDVSQWFAPSPEHRINGQAPTLNDGLSQEIGVASVSSGLVDGDGVCIDVPGKHPSNSLQSSITNTFNPDGKEKTLNVLGAENMFDCLGQEFGCGQVGESWEDIVMPVVRGGYSTISTGISECISDMDAGPMAGSRKGLFSQLGIEQLLNGVVGNSHSVSKSSFEDQLSTSKRRRTGCYSANSNQVQFTDLSCLGAAMDTMLPACNLVKTSNVEIQKEVVLKSQVGLWIDDSYSINAGNAAIAQPRRSEEPAKATKKRAKPGESNRPRPKDRQQIQDRIQELRKIIPNGAKCSIDSLLDRTIKHMLFLQSVTKHADKFKQTDQPKLIGQDNGVVLKDNPSGGGGGGATWAFEVGIQTMVCPIIVEDLSPPGQMLIEMLCEDRGFFLEIADIIRGYGLNILKGVMEFRENKIWAHFIVEANRHITRMDVFWSLVQLLQQTGTSGNIDSANQPSNVANGIDIPQFNNYQQTQLRQPISLAEQLR